MNDVRDALSFSVVLSLGAMACSLGALDGFSSGGPPAETSSGDASSGTDAGSGTSPPAEGGLGDAGVTLDCDAGAHLLCITFDDGMLARGWEAVTTLAGGTLALDGDARSAPFALRAQLPAQTGVGHPYARVGAGFDGALAVRVAFDVKLASASFGPTDRAVALFEINYGSSGNSSYWFRTRDGMTLSSEQNGTYTPVEPLPYDEWTRVALEVVPTTPKGTLRLSYDGRTVYENTTVPFDAFGPSPRTEVFIGLVRFDAPTPAIDARYDNVTIDRLP